VVGAGGVATYTEAADFLAILIEPKAATEDVNSADAISAIAVPSNSGTASSSSTGASLIRRSMIWVRISSLDASALTCSGLAGSPVTLMAAYFGWRYGASFSANSIAVRIAAFTTSALAFFILAANASR